jgi:hypothetical protein
MSIGMAKALFVISGLYDGLMGAIFALVPAMVFRIAGVTPPNHWGYVRFPALLLVVFGVMFFRIAADPLKRREQILYGMGLKAAYFSVVFWYQLRGGVPALWIPWAYADVAFFLLFAWAWISLPREV